MTELLCDVKTSLETPALEGEETAEIYRREAKALYETNAVRAAKMLIDAAYANDRDEAVSSSIVRDLLTAVTLAPSEAWVASAARRLLVKIGRWGEALALLEREIELASTTDLKIACALEAASIVWIVQDDPEGALRWVERALKIDPCHVGALYDALWLDCARERALESAHDAEKLAKILGAPEERAVLFTFAANIHAGLGDDECAHVLYNSAVQADRNALYALLGLAWLDEKRGNFAEAAQNWASAAARFDKDTCAGEFYAHAGTMYYYVGDLVKACACLEEAQKRIHENSEILALELEACVRLGNTTRAVELEKRLIETADSPRAQAARYVELARILAASGDEKSASEALSQSAALGMNAQLVFDWRCALEEKALNYEALISCYSDRLDTCRDASLSEFYVWQLARVLMASGHLSEAIKLMRERDVMLCRWRCACALEASSDAEALVRKLDQWLSGASDEGMCAALRSQIMTILIERLDHPEIALQYVKTFPENTQSFDLVLRRQSILVALDQREALLESYKKIASLTKDVEDVKMWFMEAAASAVELKKFDEAMQILKSLHDMFPTYVPTIEFFHAIALRAGDWNQVVISNAWRSEVWVTRQAEFAVENAWGCLEMGLVDKAIEWFSRAQSLSSLDAASLRGYLRLLRQTGRYDEAVKLLVATVGSSPLPENAVKAEDVSDTDDNDVLSSDEFDALELSKMREREEAKNDVRVNLNKISAEKIDISPEFDVKDVTSMRETILDIRSYCMPRTAGTSVERARVYLLEPSFKHYLQYVLEVMISLPRSQQLQAILEATGSLEVGDEEAKSLILWLKAELIMRDAEDTKSRVDLMLRASLNRSYGMGLRAEILRRLRGRSGEDVSVWLETYAASTPDRWVAAELMREASLRNMWIDHDFEAVKRTSLAAFRQGGNDWRSLWELERFADQSEDYQALGVLRERMATLEVEPAARLQALKSALAPYVDEGLDDHAVRVAQECLKQDPHDFVALLTLAHIAEDDKNVVQLASIADRLAESACLPENRLSYGLWAARLWRGLGRNDQAFSSLNALLSHDPASMPAITLCEQILSATAQWEKLSLVYVRAIGALTPCKLQIELLRRHASLLATRLDDQAGASLALSRILTQAPEDIDALTEQTKLLSQQSRWSEAVETLELRIKCTNSPEERRKANIALADILIHHVEDLVRARRILRRHLTQFVHDLDALRLMYDISCRERNWLEARVTLDEICQEESPLYHWARLAYTRIAREAEWSNDIRVIYERNAIATAIGHRDDFDALVDDYVKHGDIERLIRVAKYDLSKTQEADKIAQYRGCVAALYVANGQHREALSFLSDVIGESGQTDWAYLARAQALFCAGQLESSAAEFRRTLTLNLNMEKAYEPFLEVLRQLGDEVAQKAAKAFVDHRTGQPHVSERCLGGSPRGFFDIEMLRIERVYNEAFQYLRLMTPYIYPLYEQPMKLVVLDQKHWAMSRCRQLFGQKQNFEVKQLYISKLSGNLGCVRLTDPPSLILAPELVETPTPEFDFWAAYAMHQATSGAAVLDVIDDEEADALFAALCQPEPEARRAQALKKLISKRIPRSDRKLFKDGVPFKAPSWSGFRAALSTRAACVAAIMSGAPSVALKAFPEDEELQRFILSDTYVRLLKLYFNYPTDS